MKPQSPRLVGVDVLRALAVTGVLAVHLFSTGWLRPPHGVIELAVVAAGRLGGLGVDLFFAISGFVIAGTVIRRDGGLDRLRIGAFYRRRVARIAPALLLFLLLGIITAGAVPASPAAAAIVHVPAAALFWPAIATFTFNYLLSSLNDCGLYWAVLWSLSVEEQFYFLFPLLRRAGRWLFPALAAITAFAVATRWLDPASPGRFFATPSYLDLLALGVAAAALPRFALPGQWARRMATLGLAVLILAPTTRSWVALPLLIGLGAVLVMLACQNGAIFTGRIWRPLARLGRVSYGMYLFHWLVLWQLAPLLHGMAPLPALALFVGAVWLAAEASFRLLEEPAARWIILSTRRAPALAAAE